MLPQLHIFARLPLLGTVKTRLARDIGDAAALRFYRDTMFATARRLAADTRWRTILAVTPDGAEAQGAAWPPGIDRVPQGGGDLGARMLRVLQTARPDAPALVVGSDIPSLDAPHVARAVAAFAAADLVLGPAGDGGYWLIGAACPPPPDLFRNVRWSTEHALADTLANAGGLRTALVDTLADIDTGADLRAAGLIP